jgi:hypothetical protein
MVARRQFQLLRPFRPRRRAIRRVEIASLAVYKDIIVHAGGQTNYQVYRLLRGHRYLVFEIDENTYNWRETIDTKVRPLGPGKLATLRTRGKATTCTNWLWNPAKFRFEPVTPKPAKCPQ